MQRLFPEPLEVITPELESPYYEKEGVYYVVFF